MWAREGELVCSCIINEALHHSHVVLTQASLIHETRIHGGGEEAPASERVLGQIECGSRSFNPSPPPPPSRSWLFVLDSRASIKIQRQAGSGRVEGSFLFFCTCSDVVAKPPTPTALSPPFLSSPPPLFFYTCSTFSLSLLHHLHRPPPLPRHLRAIFLNQAVPFSAPGESRSHPSSAPSGGRVHCAAERVGAHWVG